jgi:hypothetical protein
MLCLQELHAEIGQFAHDCTDSYPAAETVRQIRAAAIGTKW